MVVGETIRVFEKRNRNVISYKGSEFTPEDVRMHASLNVHHYAYLITDEYPDGVYIDLSTMMQEQIVGQALEWTTFFQNLTPAMIDSYLLSGAGLTDDNTVEFKQATVIQPLTTVGLDIAYCDIRDPSITNLYYKRWDMPDLAIKKLDKFKNDLKDINLANCIVSVNGIVCNTSFFKDTLYVYQGTRNLWSVSKTSTPNVTMMDTTLLGELVRLPFKDCYVEFSRTGREILERNIKIHLPDSYSLNDYTPLVSLAGKIHFPDSLLLPDEKTIVLRPYTMSLGLHVLELYRAQQDFIHDSEIVSPEKDPSAYIASYKSREYSEVYDVIYLIKNTNINIQRTELTNELYWLTKHHHNRIGLLTRKIDGAWMDYTNIKYKGYDLYHGVTYPQDVMQITVDDDDYFKRQYGILSARCRHLPNHFRDTRDSKYEMIYLTC